MKHCFILITFLFIINNFYSQKEIDFSTTIFIDDLTSIKTCDSTGQQIELWNNLDHERIFLIDIISCNGNQKLKGDLVIVLQKDQIILYSPITTLQNYKFNYDYEEIMNAFKAFNYTERKEFRRISTNKNNNHYLELFEKKEAERLAIEKEIQEREEYERKKQEQAELEHFQMILQIARKDSVFAVNRHLELIDRQNTAIEASKTADLLVTKGKANGGILITQFDVFEDIGTGVTFEIFNCLSKRIKYIQFSVKAFNPVNDQVGTSETVKGIGWIESMGSGKWTFEDIWYSDVIDHVRITSIKLTFEDGTIKTISDVSKIRCDNDNYEGSLAEDLELHYLSKELGLSNHVIGSLELSELGETILIQYTDIQTLLVEKIEVNPEFVKNLNLIISDFETTTTSTVRGNFYTTLDYNKNIYLISSTGKKTVLQYNELIELSKFIETKTK
jgi:hypothetical protein